MITACKVKPGVHPAYFTWGQGADPEAKYNLYLILTNCVIKIV